MKKQWVLILLAACFLFSFHLVNGQEQTGLPSSQSSIIAYGGNIGLQKAFCDVLHTGFGPAAEFMMKLLVSNRFHLSAALGYGEVNDGFTNNTFKTSLFTGDLKANINLMNPSAVNPYLFFGLGIFNFSYDQTQPHAIGNPAIEGERYFDGSFIFGGGLEVMVSPKVALNAFADYRHTTGDALDGAELGASKDGYLNVRAGITYYPGGRRTEQPSGQDLLALERTEFGGTEEPLLGEGNENLSMFEAKLDKLDAEESEFTMEQYVRLKSRIDELSSLIDTKERELEELRASLDFKNQRISDLESELSRAASGRAVVSTSAGFSIGYEEALRDYYSRDYQQSINVFQSLLNTYPNHKLAGNSQYWIGESYFGLGDYVRAAEAFQKVFDFADSYKKDDATLMLGRCYVKLQDISRARSYFQGLINEYPDSEYVEKAKEWLSRIG